jgi:hypothetical protein
MRLITVFVVVAVTVAVVLGGCTSSTPPSPAAPSPTPEQVRVSVFVGDDLADTQRQAIETKLRAVPGAVSVTFRRREETYRALIEIYRDQPELTDQVGPDDLPESFQLIVHDRAAAEAAATEIRALPGVTEVNVMPLTGVSITGVYGIRVGVDARFSHGGSIKTITDSEVGTTPDGITVAIVAVSGDEAVLRIGKK